MASNQESDPANVIPPPTQSDETIAKSAEIEEASIEPIPDSTYTQDAGTTAQTDTPTEPQTPTTEVTKKPEMTSIPSEDLFKVDFANSNLPTPVVNPDPPLNLPETAEQPLGESLALEGTNTGKTSTTSMTGSSDSYVMVANTTPSPPQTITESQILGEIEPKSKPTPPEETWLDILGNGSLKKLIVEIGGENKPTRGQRVLLDFTGHLSEMDSPVVEEQIDFEIELGEAEVVQGLDLAVPLMTEGEVAWVFMTGRFGYGDTGNGTNIPANSDLYYKVNLKEIRPRYDYTTLSEDKIIELVEKKKSRGNTLYKLSQVALAITAYTSAIKVLEAHQYVNTSEGKTIGCRILTNLSIAQYKHEQTHESLMSCDHALRLVPNDTKALYRKSTILTERQEYEDSIICLEQALQSSPGDAIVEQELKRVRTLNDESNRRQRNVYRRMMQVPTHREQPVETNSSRSKLGVVIASGVVAITAICLGLLLYKKI